MAGPLPDQHVEVLSKLLRSDQLVLFVGAGISRQAAPADGSDAQMPLWLDLAKSVAQASGEKLENYDNNILDLFDAVAANSSRGDLEEAVRDAIPQHRFKPSPVHGRIASLPWHQITTTNYDDLLARALNETNAIDEDKKYEWLSRELGARPKLIHLHGSLATLHTLTGTDYADWQGRNLRGYSYLEHVALNKTILFAGYSFSDPHLKSILHWIQKATEGRFKRHFAWMWGINPEQIRLFDHRKITAFPINADDEWLAAFDQLSAGAGRTGGKKPSDPILPYLAPEPAAAPNKKASSRAATQEPSADSAIINGYKLFFYRTKMQKSLKWLSRETGIDGQIINRLEQVKTTVAAGPGCFKSASRSDLAKIEHALDSIGKLEFGQSDDFLATYQMYYEVNKKPVRSSSGTIPLDFVPDTKAVVFDFGGTLTRSTSRLSTWEKMWDAVGYTTTEAGEYHRQFLRKNITHQEWCDLTAEKLRERGFSRDHLAEVTKTIKPVPGLNAAIRQIHDQGTALFIVSGSIRQIISAVLGDTFSLFSEVKANEVTFDRNGIIRGIRGTKFDFEGKAEFLRRVIADLNCQPMEVLFVGNSLNDIWASQSGARTLCVNPADVDYPNTLIWTDFIKEMKDLREILSHADRTGVA